MNNTLFMCLIEEPHAEDAFVQVYWARATHLGQAIQMMLDAAKTNGLCNPIPRECDPFDIENLEGEVEPSAEADVFGSVTRHFFPPEPFLALPIGVIASCVEGEHDVDEIARAYAMQEDGEGLTTLEVNVESDQLFPLYSKLLQLRPEYKVFWYILHSHWEDETEDRFLVNEGLNTPAKIIAHLNDNLLNSIQNGFVTLTAYLEEGATNLKISDHKRIVVSTYSSTVAAQYAEELENSGYRRASDLVGIDHKIHHWHYRVPGCAPKAALEILLKQAGFTDWKPKPSQEALDEQ
jgi:hypothetical protein